MKLPVHLANNLFKINISAYDEKLSRIKGQPKLTELPERIISGTIQPAGDKDAVLFEDGQQSDGAMILHTTAPIYTYDSSNKGDEILIDGVWFRPDNMRYTVDASFVWVEGAEVEIPAGQLQTFVRYKGEVWKATRIQNWSDHIQGGVNRYGLVKYVNINNHE